MRQHLKKKKVAQARWLPLHGRASALRVQGDPCAVPSEHRRLRGRQHEPQLPGRDGNRVEMNLPRQHIFGEQNASWAKDALAPQSHSSQPIAGGRAKPCQELPHLPHRQRVQEARRRAPGLDFQRLTGGGSNGDWAVRRGSGFADCRGSLRSASEPDSLRSTCAIGPREASFRSLVEFLRVQGA